MQRGCPSNISIQDQKLDCQGDLRGKRFGNPGEPNNDGKPWDGIHLRGWLGSRHYTNSAAKIFANCFPAMKIDWTANQSGDGNYHKTCAQASYQRRQFGSFRPARQGNYRQHNQNNYYSRHTDGFSQQTTAGQSRGFKKNNVKHRNNYHGQGVNTENVYTIPVSNRFQGNC